MLASSGSGTAVRSGHKGARLLACNAHPTRVGGGVTEGRPRANNMASNRHAPGPQRWKASRSLRAHSPSREGARARVSADSVRARGVSSPAQHHRVGDHGVLEQLRRRGASSHLVMRRSHARRGEVLHSRLLGPRSSSSSYQPVAGATGGGVAASPASGVAKSDDLQRSHLSACLQRREADVVGADAARCPLIPKGVGCRTPCSSKGAAREAGANTEGDWLKRPDVQGGRGSDARKGCARASLVCCRSR